MGIRNMLTQTDYERILREELGTDERIEKFNEIWTGRDLDVTDCGWADTPEDNVFTRTRQRMSHTFGKQKVEKILSRFRALLGD